MNVFDDDDDGGVVVFPFLAMFMHIFGKSDQNMVVIVSNERQTTEQYGLLVTSSHGSELHVSGLSREPPDLYCLPGSGSAQSWTLLIGHVNDIAFCIILTPFTNSL